MGQSASRRCPAPATTPAPAAAPGPEHANDTCPPRRSLPRRILSSIPKPSLRSRPLSSSLTLPTRPEQTLRGKNRRWRLSRRHSIPANTEGAVPPRMDTLAEHDEHQVDRDVDEFGVITHRVPDNHSDSPAASTKGKEKAEDIPDITDDNEDDDGSPIPSTSTASSAAQSGADWDPVGNDEVVIAPTAPPSPPCQPPPLPPAQESERPSVRLPSVPTPPSPPQPSTQQTNPSPRPFPPPGTLVVVQGVVHTTDVPRSSDRPTATSNPIPPTTNDAVYSSTTPNLDPNSTRPSSVPPEPRTRNPLSSILPRPTSMVPAAPSPPEPVIGSPNIDSQAQRTTSSASGAAEDREDEDRQHPHPQGISIAQGPVGASGLSASSIDVLGTLLSVAAAATAASLLTGSSEPIFSSGLTSSQSSPSSDPTPQHAGFNSNVPSERPLSPTPTSDAGRMRHVWSSLRDRLGLGSGHNSNHSNDATSSLGAQNTSSQSSDIVRTRDPREIMLAEMARAFNLGLGLGGTTASTPSTTASTNTNTTELMMPDEGNVLPGERDGERPSLPPPDSFERFLMDLQTDLRVTLMQEQEPGVTGATPLGVDDTAEGVEVDQSIPDSDSEEFGTRHFESDDEDELDCEDDVDNEVDEEDAHTAHEQLSGRTSPAVSALGTGTPYPFGISERRPSLSAGGTLPHTALSASTTTSLGIDGEIAADNSAMDNSESEDVGPRHASLSVSVGRGVHVTASELSPSVIRSEEESGLQEEGAALGVAHSQDASNRALCVDAEGCHAISRPIAVPPLDAQDPSNVPETAIGRDSSPRGTSFSSSPSASTIPNSLPGSSTLTSQVPAQSTTPTSVLSSDPEPTTFPTNPDTGNPPMPFRLPFTPSSASRTEHTPGGGINWWRMYRFPAIASPNPGQQGGSQGLSPLSQPSFRTPTQGPNHTSTSPWTRTDQNEMMASRGVTQVSAAHSGLAQSAPTPSAATLSNMPEVVYGPNQSTIPPPSSNGQDFNPPTNASINHPEQRSNVVVPVIVVGLQSVSMDRQPPHIPHPHTNHAYTTDEEDGEGMEFDGLEQPMSLPLHIPEPAEFRHRPTSSSAIQQEQSSQQPARGRTWQSRAANAIRNLRPSRRNADATSPQPQETPGSRTFLIYVIGGYYPPDHQIITGGNLDSFEALWELAELLGQVKPPTVSKEEIEKSGLEIIKASMLGEYERQGRVASNCVDRCLICLDDYTSEDELRVLTCKHTFHQGCVDRWLETGRNNCPACRSKGVGNENPAPTSATTPA